MTSQPPFKRRAVLILAGGTILAGIAGYVSCARAPVDAELRGFLRRSPDAFRPTIAKYEGLFPARFGAPPIAVHLGASGRVRIVPGSNAADGELTALNGAFAEDRSYLRPLFPSGEGFDRISLASYSGIRSVLVLTPAGIDGTVPDQDAPTFPTGGVPLVVEGESHAREIEGNARGRSGDLEIRVEDGDAPTQVALAPAELPANTAPEPQGYALLWDRSIISRQRFYRAEGPHRITEFPSFSFLLPISLAKRLSHERRVVVEQQNYRVASLVHVYRRKEGRWLYTRSWRLEGVGDAHARQDVGPDGEIVGEMPLVPPDLLRNVTAAPVGP